MVLPNFMIIGVAKAGTSWLSHTLRQHPDIYMPLEEIHYFNRASNFERGVPWYQEHFAGVTTEKAIGEKSVYYLAPPQNNLEKRAKMIHDMMPDGKLIAVLRDPVERAISAYNHMCRRQSPLTPIDAFFRNAIDNTENIVWQGFYNNHIQQFYKYYDKENFLILIYEQDIVHNKPETLRRVCQFLNISDNYEFQDVDRVVRSESFSRTGAILTHYIPGRTGRAFARRVDRYLHLDTSKEVPGDQIIAELYEIYREPNEGLFKLLNRRIDQWKPRG